MPSWEQETINLRAAGGSIAGILGVVASAVGPTQKGVAFIFAGLGFLILILTVYAQLRQRKTAGSFLTYGLIAASLMVFGYFGYSELLRSSAATNVASPSPQQVPNVAGTAETTGDNSPAISGSGNAVTYGSVPPNKQ